MKRMQIIVFAVGMCAVLPLVAMAGVAVAALCVVDWATTAWSVRA